MRTCATGAYAPQTILCLHSTLVQCGLFHRVDVIIPDNTPFTFHPGSMRTCENKIRIKNKNRVYIPPWFNADACVKRITPPPPFTFHPGSMRTPARARCRARARSFTFHPGSMRTSARYCARAVGRKFTFHPGSMRTNTPLKAVACIRIVYIPPWFNADLLVVGYMAMMTISLHSTLVQCGLAGAGALDELMDSVYIPPWFNADLQHVHTHRIRFRRLHSTLVQCGQRYCYDSDILLSSLHSTLVQCGPLRKLLGFTNTLVYIPPWFNADRLNEIYSAIQKASLHSTLVQCGLCAARRAACMKCGLHSTLVQCGLKRSVAKSKS